MKQSEDKIQTGSLRRVPRARGKWAWEWRYIDPESGDRKSKYLSGDEYPTERDVQQHLECFVERLNSTELGEPSNIDPTVEDLLHSFIEDEGILDIVQREPGERANRDNQLAYSTAKTYLSLSKKIRERWGKTKLDELRPHQFKMWLIGLKGAPKSKGHLKAFMNLLLNHAKLHGLLDFHENPMSLVRVRGISKRTKKPAVLTIDQIYLVLGLLPRPYFDMALVAQCTGLRIEEVLALDWSKIDFERLCMKVDEAVVHGRLGPVKTEYSDDELPLDPEFATDLLDWKRVSNGEDSGLVFPSHITGGCYHASPLQQDWIRRAGFCLVACPECGAAPGVRCTGFPVKRNKRPLIGVHDARREAATEAGFGSIGWHTFRHTYRALLSDSDTPLEVQQKLMRHADIRTTVGYGELPMDSKREANSKVNRKILQRRSAG